ncbi:MAG TPA: hypothetical protein VLA19_21100 [Herpetosiphonaceae bacterium]|nr:hypothetical protein [Herpetosiphonaceae bacterium]
MRKRELAWDVLRASNEPVVGFAKLMVPTALSSVGAIIALAQAGGRLVSGTPRSLILAACGLNLLAMLFFAWVVYARPIRVSAEDYDDVLEELLKAASTRQRVATAGLGLLTLGAVLAVLAFAIRAT